MFLWYIPSIHVTFHALKLLVLVSTQVVFDTYGEKFVCQGNGHLEGTENDLLRSVVVVSCNQYSNLLISMMTRMPLSTNKVTSKLP
jgi:hypothetical protein